MTNLKCALTWLLFPMIHIGPAEYFAEVERRMNRCDLVLAEGIDSRIASALTMAYRAADGSQLQGTVAQPRYKPGPSGPEVVNADMSAAEFDEGWRQLPLPVRFGVPLLAPLYGLWLRYIADPDEFHRNLETYDLPSRRDIETESAFPAFFDLLIHRRDAHLLDEIDAVQRRHEGDDLTIGIAYGARHMPAVVNHLTDKLGYIAASAEWITVFDYTK